MFKIQFRCRLKTFDICNRVQNRVPRSARTEPGSSHLREDEEDRVIISCQTSLSSWHWTSSSKINLQLTLLPSARGKPHTRECGKPGSWLGLRGQTGWDHPQCPEMALRASPRQGQGQGRWERRSRYPVCSAWPPSSPPLRQTRQYII